jgi:hypothetical protein
MNPNFNIFLVKNNLQKASPKGERDLTINDNLFIIPVKKQCPLFIL